MSRRREPVLADCGYCVLEGPDEFGNYDLVELPDCPVHGFEAEERESLFWPEREEGDAA